MKTGQVAVYTVLVLVSAQYCVSTPESQPSIRLMVTKKGLDYLNEIGRDIIVELIQSQLEGREISGKTKLGSSDLVYGVKDMKLNELEIQKSSFFSDPQTGLNLKLEDVNVNVSTFVSVSIGTSLLNGTLFVATTGLKLHLAIMVKRDDDGQPLFNITNCSFEAGNYSLHITGVLSALLSGSSEIIDKYAKDGKMLCALAKNQAEEALKALLPDNKVIKIEKYAGINYAFTRDPVFMSDHILTEHEGDFRSLTIPGIKPPFERVSLPSFQPEDCVDKMACMWATEYVANTASVVYKRAGKIVYTFSEDTDDDDGDTKKKLKNSFFQLDTSTLSLIVPQLFYRYPNRNLTLTARAVKEVPSVSITDTQAELKIPAAVDVYVNDTEQGNYPVAFTMNVSASITATLGVGNNTRNQSTFSLTANISRARLTVTDSESNIGTIYYKKINKLITFFKLIKDHLVPSLNKQAKKGYGIHLVDNLTFVDANLTHFKGGLFLGTDFDYEVT